MLPTSSAMRRALPVIAQASSRPMQFMQPLAMTPRGACPRSLNIPEGMLRMATPPAAPFAFEKCDIPHQQLKRSQADWNTVVTKLNLALCEPDSPTHKLKLKRSEIIGMGLAVLQAGHHLNLRLDAPVVLSLISRLLSRLPVDQHLIAKFEPFADELSDRLLPYTELLSQSGDWYQKPPSVRKNAIEAGFQQVYLQAQRSELAPDRSTSMEINWWNAPVFSEVATFASDDERSAHLALPGELTELNAEMFAQNYDGLLKELPCALIIPRISHAIFNLRQLVGDAVLNDEKPATHAQWGRIIANSMGMGIQSCLMAEPAAHSGAELSFYHLPHQKEGWALRFGVIKAMIKSPSVPDHYRTALEGYLSEHFDIFKAVRGLPGVTTSVATVPSDQSNPSKYAAPKKLHDSVGASNMSAPVRGAGMTPWSLDKLYALDKRVYEYVYRAAELNKFLREPARVQGDQTGKNSYAE